MAEENSFNTDDKIVLLLDELIAEQQNTVANLNRIRNHLAFYTVMLIISFILGFFVVPIFSTGSWGM